MRLRMVKKGWQASQFYTLTKRGWISLVNITRYPRAYPPQFTQKFWPSTFLFSWALTGKKKTKGAPHPRISSPGLHKVLVGTSRTLLLRLRRDNLHQSFFIVYLLSFLLTPFQSRPIPHTCFQVVFFFRLFFSFSSEKILKFVARNHNELRSKLNARIRAPTGKRNSPLIQRKSRAGVPILLRQRTRGQNKENKILIINFCIYMCINTCTHE